MKFNAIACLTCLVLFSFLAIQVNAEGLSEYLQNPEVIKVSDSATNSFLATDSDIDTSSSLTTIQAKDSVQLKNIIELVVAGIVAAALIIVVLVIFLGRWLAGREKKLIKGLRIEAEENVDHITSAATSVREQEKETTSITHTMRDQANELSIQLKQSEVFSKKIISTFEEVKEHEKQLDSVTSNMSKIQKYWDTQVNETVETISSFQHNLSENINIASEGLNEINEQRALSDDLLQNFLTKHNEQNSIIENNSEISEKVSANLTRAYTESNKLLELLKRQQEQAERSLNDYSERLNTFEEQAYEQFDTSFQVADLARQELSANLDENRMHIETMRRQEEQSHGLNTQIVKNLEALDYSKIVKISTTLDTTQNMFDDIHQRVDETRLMLNELKQIEEDIKLTASNVEHVTQSHSILDQHDAEIDKEIDDIIENAEKVLEQQEDLAEDITAKKELLTDHLEDNIVDVLDNPSEKIRGNTTVAITDYKMASGNSSTPLSFFRDLKKNNTNT